MHGLCQGGGWSCKCLRDNELGKIGRGEKSAPDVSKLSQRTKVRRGEAGKLLKQLKGIRSVTPPR
jgi:hypothetical protein